MRIWYWFIWWLVAFPAYAQTDTTGQIKFSGFVDAYFAYDFNQPPSHIRPDFLYNHNRHHEFTINLAYLKGSYATDRVRSNLALMTGTYPTYNLAAEPRLLQLIHEANAGVKLSHNLWLDAGVFASHIGLESAVSTENLTLTRSLAAENSPYYESGLKLTYAFRDKWIFTGLVLNGWQNIREQPGNTNKAVGTQIQYKLNQAILFNASTFIGNEQPDSAKQIRYYHDFYLVWRLNSRVKLAALFDIGAQKKMASANFDFWYTPTFILQYKPGPPFALAARVEYFQDKAGVIIKNLMPAGIKTTGYSLNFDYAPAPRVWCRLEGRLLHNQQAIFWRNRQPVSHAAAVTTSVAVNF